MRSGAYATHIYWVDEIDGTVWRANLDGSDPRQLESGQSVPEGIAVYSGHIYWSNSDGTIWEAKLDGSDATLLDSGQADPIALAVGP